MPYKDPEKRRAAQRRAMRRLRGPSQGRAGRRDPTPSPSRRGFGVGGVTFSRGARSGGLAVYLSGLRISQGPRAGERFGVLSWQADFLRLWDGPRDLV